MIVDKLFKGKSASYVAVFASIGFVVGSIYMYNIPLGKVAEYLIILVLLTGGLILLAGMMAGLIVLVRKIFSDHD